MSASLASYLFAAEFGPPDETRPAAAGVYVSAELAARVREGDEQAFAELFEVLYAPLVRFAARYSHSQAAAEDAVQDVFAKVWVRRTELVPRASVASYFYNAVRNRVRNIVAHDTVIEVHASEGVVDFPVSAGPPAPDALVLAHELAALAARRVSTLSPRLREIYRLSREDGLSPAEIADVLGTTVQTIYVQLGRIMRALYPTLAAWFEAR